MRSFNSQPEKHEYQKKSEPNSKHGKKIPSQVKVCKNYLCANLRVAKKLHSQRVKVINSFVVSRVNYCNRLLSGAPANLTDHILLMWLLIHGRECFDLVTHLIHERLHWLQIWKRIAFKCALPTYNGLAPAYNARSCMQLSTIHNHYALRSIICDTLIIPKFGEQSFTVAGLTVWNTAESCKRCIVCRYFQVQI